VRQLTRESPWDVRSAGAFGNTLVYEVGGRLKSLDLDSGQIRSIPVRLSVQSNQARPQWKDAVKNITSASLSPTGKRVLITARGDVFSVPVKDGSVRNLTATSGVREADALWSKDGIAYVYLPDTADGGFTFFNRMFFAESDKEALIVDDRRNSGGQAADYVLEVLDRRYLSGWKDRDGLVFNTPAAAIYGPKAMLIDQDAGSGGDYFPWIPASRARKVDRLAHLGRTDRHLRQSAPHRRRKAHRAVFPDVHAGGRMARGE
jgi:hypothetical protein